MKFTLTKPCKGCPFRKDCPPRWLTKERAEELVSQVILGDISFSCHKTVNYEKWSEAEEQSGEPLEYSPDGSEQFCAGALIMEKKCNQGGNLIVRLARIFFGFKYENLKDENLVFDTTEEFINHHS